MVTTAELEQKRPSELTIGEEGLNEHETQVFVQMMGSLGFFKQLKAVGEPDTKVTAEMIAEAGNEALFSATNKLQDPFQSLSIVKPDKKPGSSSNTGEYTVTQESAYMKYAVQAALGIFEAAGFMSSGNQEQKEAVYDALRAFREQPIVVGRTDEYAPQRLIVPLSLFVLLEAAKTDTVSVAELTSNPDLSSRAGISTIQGKFRGLRDGEPLSIFQKSSTRRDAYQLSPFGHVLAKQVMPMFAQRAKQVVAGQRAY